MKAGREDLIGFDKKCLIKPRKMHTDGGWDKKTSKSDKNSNSSYGIGKNAGVRKNLKNATTWTKIFKIHEKNIKKTQFVQQNT